jgi:hypothetical protein
MEEARTETPEMRSTSSEGRGPYGAAYRHVGEDVDAFVERSLDEGHQPDAIPYPQETSQD